MKNNQEIIVAFHISRGRRFFNPGYITFLPDVHCLQDLFDDNTLLITEDEDGNQLPVDKHLLLDNAGKELLHGQAIYEKTGVLDFDGEYDSYHVCYLEDVPEKYEPILINEVKKNRRLPRDIRKAIIEHIASLGYEQIVIDTIDTLEQLADYINSNAEWETEISAIIERNGWEDETVGGFGVCSDDTSRVILNDNGKAIVADK